MEENQVMKITIVSQMESLFLALLAGCWFALANYILGTNSKLGILTREAAENGALVFILIYIIYLFYRYLTKDIPVWTWEDSNYCNIETMGIHWPNVLATVIYTLLNFFSGFVIVYTFELIQFSLI